ncbi:hypothetical protein H0H81_005153 [Sphagnurus paluster]|uniref:Uncharacterized protein n=1 Tax=Sphagnurus paluster TaxID=117069 RepID=A0A9P7KMB1_9AGAR|nr:hypothetical protein H0H81_005153 [Sphagnurus paluster]
MVSSQKSSDHSEKHVEDVTKDVERVNEDYADDSDFVRRTLRKADMRMLPLLGLLYAIALIDRTNLGIARIAGMEKDLIIEGIITIVLGLLTYLFVADFPDKNRFLTPEQTKMILDRVEKDRGDSLPDEMTWEKLRRHLSDWTMWAFGTRRLPFASI